MIPILAGCAAEEEPKRIIPPPAEARERAPDRFRARLETTKGEVIIEVVRAWGPIGADRLYNMIRIGWFDDVVWFRVMPGFMAQCGIHGDPRVNRAWADAFLEDEPRKRSNAAGTISFGTIGGRKNSRSTHIFINTVDNQRLDAMGFVPVGRVVEGLDIVRRFHRCEEVRQDQAMKEGDAYFRNRFPRLDRIVRARIIE